MSNSQAESAGKITSRFSRVFNAIVGAVEKGLPLGVAAEAAIVAYPEPGRDKDDKSPSPRDSCKLLALRGEFAELCDALDAVAEKFPRAYKLAIALREQGVVQ